MAEYSGTAWPFSALPAGRTGVYQCVGCQASLAGLARKRMPSALSKVLPIVCLGILGAILANAVHHQLTAIPEFVYVLGEWGFQTVKARRMVARGVIVFELINVALLVFAVGTGITYSRRFGYHGWRAGRLSALLLLLYLQLIIILYAVNDPLLCGCGPLTLRLDGWIEELWGVFNLSAPKFKSAVPIVRNVLLSFVALVAMSRERIKKREEE